MKIKQIILLLSAIVFILLLSIFIVVNKTTKDSNQDTSLIKLSKEEISEIKLIYPDEVINLSRTSPTSSWYLLPEKVTGNEFEINMFLSEIDDLSADRVIKDIPKNQLGLITTSLVIEIINFSGQKLQCIIGDENPLKTGSFVQIVDERKPLSSTDKDKETYIIAKYKISRLKKQKQDFLLI